MKGVNRFVICVTSWNPDTGLPENVLLTNAPCGKSGAAMAARIFAVLKDILSPEQGNSLAGVSISASGGAPEEDDENNHLDAPLDSDELPAWMQTAEPTSSDGQGAAATATGLGVDGASSMTGALTGLHGRFLRAGAGWLFRCHHRASTVFLVLTDSDSTRTRLLD